MTNHTPDCDSRMEIKPGHIPYDGGYRLWRKCHYRVAFNAF